MARAILTYTKEILEKVSFDPNLFTKELRKAIHILLPDEIEEVYHYVVELAQFNPQLSGSLQLFNMAE